MHIPSLDTSVYAWISFLPRVGFKEVNGSNADNILTYHIFASFLLLQEYNYV